VLFGDVGSECEKVASKEDKEDYHRSGMGAKKRRKVKRLMKTRGPSVGMLSDLYRQAAILFSNIL
jgi:hypothetical protein